MKIKTIIVDRIVFFSMLTLYTLLTTCLFYKQSSGIISYANSDYATYIMYIIGQNIEYDITYPLFFDLSKLFSYLFNNYFLGITIATVCFNTITVFVTKHAMENILKNSISESSVAYKHLYLLSTFSTFILLFSSMLLFDFEHNFGITSLYLGTMTANPWHNATYIAAKPFALLSFVLFIDLLKKHDAITQIPFKNYAFYSIILLLATLTKPSFTLIHLVLSFIILLFRLLKAKFNNFKQTLKFCLCYIPTLIDMLYQYSNVFVSNNSASYEKGIGFEFMKVWGLYTSNLPLSIIMAIAFPLIIFALNHKDIISNPLHSASWLFYGLSLFSICFLYEKGPRYFHFNFAWGYMYGLLILFFSSIILLQTQILCYINSEKKKTLPLVKLVIESLFLLLHFKCGCDYFMIIFYGNMI